MDSTRIDSAADTKTKTTKGRKPSGRKPEGLRRRPKRAYSRDFTPGAGTDGREFKIRRIPARMWDGIQLKARKHGISLRSFILANLQKWAEHDRPASSAWK